MSCERVYSIHAGRVRSTRLSILRARQHSPHHTARCTSSRWGRHRSTQLLGSCAGARDPGSTAAAAAAVATTAAERSAASCSSNAPLRTRSSSCRSLCRVRAAQPASPPPRRRRRRRYSATQPAAPPTHGRAPSAPPAAPCCWREGACVAGAWAGARIAGFLWSHSRHTCVASGALLGVCDPTALAPPLRLFPRPL